MSFIQYSLTIAAYKYKSQSEFLPFASSSSRYQHLFMESKKRIFGDNNHDKGEKYEYVWAAASLFKTQECLIQNYRQPFKDIMKYIDGLNYQNYMTINKTREVTEKLIESN